MAAGLQDPYLAGSPVLAITGGPTASGRYRNVYQEVDAQSMFDPVTKFNAVVGRPHRLPDLLRQSFRAATTGEPGPVHLELPGPTGASLNEEFEVPDGEPIADGPFSRYPAFRFEADATSIRAALRELTSARKPLIIAGGGVTASGAQDEVNELATLLSIPVATSLDGKGTVDERGELSVGVVGSYSRECANEALRRADLLFYIGSHTGSQVTLGWHVPELGTRVVQLDISPEELGRNYRNKVSLHGDAQATLRRMVEMAEPVSDRGDWLAEVAGLSAAWRKEHAPKLNSEAVPLHPERICRELTDALPSDAVLLADTGNSGIWTGSIVELGRGQSYLRAAGSLGWSFPAAIGVKAAAPERPVVCFTGDGGFYYHIGELETAKRYGINPVILVNNKCSLSQEIGDYRPYGAPDDQADQVRKMWKFEEANFVKIAEAFGCAGFRVERPGELQGALEAALSCGLPAVIDVVTDMFAETGREYA
jgi:acetolactate synthase-1/2/3 large subunit